MTLWENGDSYMKAELFSLDFNRDGELQHLITPLVFAKLMFEGKTKAALQLLAGKG